MLQYPDPSGRVRGLGPRLRLQQPDRHAVAAEGHQRRNPAPASTTGSRGGRHADAARDPRARARARAGTWPCSSSRRCARLGFGARIVSGYLHNPDQDPAWAGARTTHAWAEVYVPGAGWITFDPTNRTVGGANLIPVAVGRDIRQRHAGVRQLHRDDQRVPGHVGGGLRDVLARATARSDAAGRCTDERLQAPLRLRRHLPAVSGHDAAAAGRNNVAGDPCGNPEHRLAGRFRGHTKRRPDRPEFKSHQRPMKMTPTWSWPGRFRRRPTYVGHPSWPGRFRRRPTYVGHPSWPGLSRPSTSLISKGFMTRMPV